MTILRRTATRLGRVLLPLAAGGGGEAEPPATAGRCGSADAG